MSRMRVRARDVLRARGAAARRAAAPAAGNVRRNVRALAGRALDVDVRAVALRDAVDHRESQAGAALALGGEERLEAAAPRVLVHADAAVGDLDEHARTSSPVAVRPARSVSGPPSGMASTALNTRFTSASRISLSTAITIGIAGGSFDARLDDHAALLRHVAPARAREIEHLAQHAFDAHRRAARAARLARR